MGKKGLASIFSKLVDNSSSVVVADDGGGSPSPPWPWPSCRNPQTASFREDDRPYSTTAAAAAVRRRPAAAGTAARLGRGGGAREMYKTVNSIYQLDYSADGSCFENEEGEERGAVEMDDDDDGFSTTAASEEWSEAVIRSLGRTSTDGRFFVDPGPASNSILPAAKLAPAEDKAAMPDEKPSPESEPSTSTSTSLVEESLAVAVDSEDPYRDFRASMEEMVAAHGLRGWDALEELLVWYLRINGKHNHALIVGAFVDLLVGLATPPSSAAPTTTTTTTTTTRSTATTTTTTTSSTSTSESTASTSASSSTWGGDATPATTEQCRGGTSLSYASTPSDQEEEVEEAVADDRVSRNRRYLDHKPVVVVESDEPVTKYYMHARGAVLAS